MRGTIRKQTVVLMAVVAFLVGFISGATVVILKGTDVRTSYNSSRPSFNQSVQPLPLTGVINRFILTPMGGTQAPLRIVTRQSDYHYFVKLSDWSRTYTVLTMFIRSGETAKVDVPLGSYKIKYASGKLWYGEPYLFGPETSYYEADKKFDFEVHGSQVSGYTIELILQPQGNLRTNRISAEQF